MLVLLRHATLAIVPVSASALEGDGRARQPVYSQYNRCQRPRSDAARFVTGEVIHFTIESFGNTLSNDVRVLIQTYAYNIVVEFYIVIALAKRVALSFG